MEIQILEWIQTMRTPFLDSFFKILTTLGNRGEIWLFCIILLAIPKKTRKVAALAALALIIQVTVVSGIMKPFIMRPRPFTLHPVTLLIPIPLESSFPSGHAASSFAVASVIVLKHVKGRWFVFATAVLMAFSRLYMFVHYPTDVLAGALIGFLIAWLVCKYETVIFKAIGSIKQKFQH